MGIKVVKSGMLTTVQDLGRIGFQKYGMVVSGAMDAFALRLGNIMLGNAEKEAALECTTIGPALYFTQSQLICITGADLSPKIDGRAVAMWKPIFVVAGATLTFGKSHVGRWSYICFYGGLDIEQVMGSRSTYLKAAIGGWQGRALVKEDHISFRKNYSNEVKTFNWQLSSSVYSACFSNRIRVVEGPHYGLFDAVSRQQFFSQQQTVTKASDRMGYRLASTALHLKEPTELLSSAVTFGTVQVPPQGQAIILMADRPTTGGYPILAQVATVDLPILAQKRPEENIQLELISLEKATTLLKKQQLLIAQIKRSIALAYER